MSYLPYIAGAYGLSGLSLGVLCVGVFWQHRRRRTGLLALKNSVEGAAP